MEPVPSPAWSRDFNPGYTSVVWLLVGVLFLIVGVVFVLAGTLMRLAPADSPSHFFLYFQLGGAVGILASGYLFWIWYTSETKRVVCGPEGFRTETLSRRSTSRTTVYRWNDVVATRYKVDEWTSHDDGTTYFHKYNVSTADGESIEFDDTFRGQAELIDLYNAMTPHLPYVWLPRQRGQDWEHVSEPPGPLTGQTRPVHPSAKYVCAPPFAGGGRAAIPAISAGQSTTPANRRPAPAAGLTG